MKWPQLLAIKNNRGISHHAVLVVVVIVAVCAIGGFVVFKNHAVALDSAIVSGDGGLCLDDLGASSTPNSAVEIEKCNSSQSTQSWQSANGDQTIRINGLCLAPTASNGPSAGSPVKLLTCQANAYEQWSYQNGTLVDQNTDFCLSVPTSSSGTAAQLAQCNSSFNDQWTIPSPATNMLGASGEIGLTQSATLTSNGSCMDDKNNSSNPGNVVQLWECNNHPSQTWGVFGDESIRIHGLCLATSNNSAASATGIVIEKCNNESSEAWIAGSNDTVVNVASGRCLSAVSTTTGRQLEIVTCNGSNNNQWTLPINNAEPISNTVSVAPNVTENKNTVGGPQKTLPTQAIAQKNKSVTQEIAENAAVQHDLLYILGKVKSDVKCTQLHSTYTKQLLRCK